MDPELSPSTGYQLFPVLRPAILRVGDNDRIARESCRDLGGLKQTSFKVVSRITVRRRVRVHRSYKSFSYLACVLVCAGTVLAQRSAKASVPGPPTFTADQDRQNMMDQLGIKALRPGFSGNEKAPNHANYDEEKANPYPDVPDPLTTNNGEKVTTAKIWWEKRRPEIVEMYEKEVYGRVPANMPKVNWTVTTTDHETIGFTPVTAKDLIGMVDNSAYPEITVKIHGTLVTPDKRLTARACAESMPGPR